MNTKLDITKDQQLELVLEAFRYEPAYYLETTPTLLKIFLGIDPIWMTGTDEDTDLKANEFRVSAKLRNQDDPEKLVQFFSGGKPETQHNGYFNRDEFFWEITIELPGRLMIREDANV